MKSNQKSLKNRRKIEEISKWLWQDLTFEHIQILHYLDMKTWKYREFIKIPNNYNSRIATDLTKLWLAEWKFEMTTDLICKEFQEDFVYSKYKISTKWTCFMNSLKRELKKWRLYLYFQPRLKNRWAYIISWIALIVSIIALFK